MISGEPISGGPISSAPLVAGTGTVTAAVAVTQADDTASAAATVAVSASEGVTQAGDSGSATATATVGASAAATQADDTGAAVGTVAVAATGAVTEAGDSGAGTGAVAVAVATAVAQAGDTVVCTATAGPPEPAAGPPGGTFRRALPTWARTVRRALPTWARTVRRALPTWPRVWRYSVSAIMTRLGTESGETLLAAVSDDREYAFDFSRCPEVQAGAVIASAAIEGGTGLTIGTPSVLADDFDDIPAGQGVSVRISGGTANTTYGLALVATLDSGRKVTVPGRLRKVADYAT